MATETWVLNETLSTAGNSLVRVDISFISNGESFSYIRYIDEGMDLENQHLRYGGVSVYYSAAWTNEAYRTITFTQPVTDTTLLAWLQANGTKQETPSTNRTYDLSTSSKWANLADGEHTVKIKAKGAGYGTSSFSNEVTVTKGATVSKNWKFNGSPKIAPVLSPGYAFTISGAAYNQAEFVENFNYIYYEADWSYIAFGSAGFWDTSTNTYGASGGNILKFNTEPDGALLSFLQAHATPVDGGG